MVSPTYYEVLEVIESASAETIRGAYKHLTQRWHPDKNANNRDEAHRKTSALNAAYRVLSDPAKRREYDDSLRAERQRNGRQEADRNQSEARAQAEADMRAEEAARARASAEAQRERAQAQAHAKAQSERQEAEGRARAEAESIRQAEADARSSAFAASMREEAKARRARQSIRLGWTIGILATTVGFFWLISEGWFPAAVFGLFLGITSGLLTWKIVSEIDDFLESLQSRMVVLQVSGSAYLLTGAFLWHRYAKANGQLGFDANGFLLDGGFWGGVLAWGLLPGLATFITGTLIFFILKKRSAWFFYSITAAVLVTVMLNGNISAQQQVVATSAAPPSAQTQSTRVHPSAEAEYDRRLRVYEGTYPQLNPDLQMYDEALANRIAAQMQSYVQKGISKPDALTRAIEDHTVRQEAAAIAGQKAFVSAADARQPDLDYRPTCPAGMNLTADQSQCCASGGMIQHADGSATLYGNRCQPAL